jgi:LemA protein
LGVLLVPAVVIWAIMVSNMFKRLLVKIDEADSGIDVALTRRYDTLTKMLDVVKAYAAHETKLLTDLVKYRQGMNMEGKISANSQMNELKSRLNILAEAYPELKSSENFRRLQDAITEAEDHLQAARRVYNMNVSSFNQAIVVFPNSIIANMQNHEKKLFFEAEAAKREDVAMNFS